MLYSLIIFSSVIGLNKPFVSIYASMHQKGLQSDRIFLPSSLLPYIGMPRRHSATSTFILSTLGSALQMELVDVGSYSQVALVGNVRLHWPRS